MPDDWSEPERWAALPRGQRTDDRGSKVGFPHTAEGAVAMAVTANSTVMEGDRSAVDEQLRIYHSYVGASDQTKEDAEAIEREALETDETLARQMGVSVGQPLPAGAYVRSTVVGYKIVKQSANEVSLWVLSRVVQKNGETAKESGSYARVLNGVQWVDGDWKMTAVATARGYKDSQEQEEPPMVGPGEAAFNQAGWTAIREAS